MPTTVTAQAGDYLCALAIDAGFLDCQPLRDEPANAGKPFLTRPLQAGDVVTIPDITPKTVGKATAAKHTFIKKNAPPTSIRFVHGSPDKPYRQDATTNILEISNYVTTKGGPAMADAFPTLTVFDQKGHVDPDTFKVEVVDPAGGGTVQVKLEALKPVLPAAPGGQLTHERFTGADLAARSLTVSAKKVPSGTCYRSAYLRLVANEADQAALPAQTLLVTDMADGNNGDNDKIEILDQLVRASYERQACPAPTKCAAIAEVPIGNDKQHINLAIHIVRANVGDGTTGIGGVTEQTARRRTFKWFRRLYAQAQRSPKLVAPNIEFVDPPPDNMITIGQDSGVGATGKNSANAQSFISFTLATSPPRAAADPPDPVVILQLTGLPATLLPGDIGTRIQGAMPAGFAAFVEVNCRAFNAPNGSCDVLITRTDGKRVMIQNLSTDDTGLLAANGIQVVRVNLAQVDIDVPTPRLLVCNPQVRRICRIAPGQDGRLDFYVVGGLFGLDNNGVFSNAARGLALIKGHAVAAAFQPNTTCRFAALMGMSSATGSVMDLSDNSPFSYPHEAGHILHDGFHTQPGTANGRTEMMTGDGTSGTDAVGASKRICDLPVRIVYQFYDEVAAHQTTTPGTAVAQPAVAVARMFANGQSVFSAW